MVSTPRSISIYQSVRRSITYQHETRHTLLSVKYLRAELKESPTDGRRLFTVMSGKFATFAGFPSFTKDIFHFLSPLPFHSKHLYTSVAPLRICADFSTLMWVNSYLLNLYKDIKIPIPEGSKEHVDIRVEAVMPKIVMPAGNGRFVNFCHCLFSRATSLAHDTFCPRQNLQFCRGL